MNVCFFLGRHGLSPYDLNKCKKNSSSVKCRNGKQIKDAEIAYLVKDGIEYAVGNSIPIWMFGFVY